MCKTPSWPYYNCPAGASPRLTPPGEEIPRGDHRGVRPPGLLEGTRPEAPSPGGGPRDALPAFVAWLSSGCGCQGLGGGAVWPGGLSSHGCPVSFGVGLRRGPSKGPACALRRRAQCGRRGGGLDPPPPPPRGLFPARPPPVRGSRRLGAHPVGRLGYFPASGGLCWGPTLSYEQGSFYIPPQPL